MGLIIIFKYEFTPTVPTSCTNLSGAHTPRITLLVIETKSLDKHNQLFSKGLRHENPLFQPFIVKKFIRFDKTSNFEYSSANFREEKKIIAHIQHNLFQKSQKWIINIKKLNRMISDFK